MVWMAATAGLAAAASWLRAVVTVVRWAFRDAAAVAAPPTDLKMVAMLANDAPIWPRLSVTALASPRPEK